jgi:hypothetical protein
VGILQADAYVAYDSFFLDPARGLVEVACLGARVTRHVHQAMESKATAECQKAKPYGSMEEGRSSLCDFAECAVAALECERKART